MTQTISQGLSIPSNIVVGGTIQAPDVTNLYNALNSFSIPDAIASLIRSEFSTNVSQIATGPATTTGSIIDVPVNVPANKILLYMGSFTWQTPAGLGSLVFRNNASTGSGSTSGYLVTPVVAATTSGNGMFLLVHTPHDATYANSAIGFVAMSTGGTFTLGATGATAMTNAAWTSIGIGMGTNSSTGTLTLGYQRVWREV